MCMQLEVLLYLWVIMLPRRFKKERRIDDLNPALSYSLPTAARHVMLGSNYPHNSACNKSLGHMCLGAATTIGGSPFIINPACTAVSVFAAGHTMLNTM